VDKLPHSLKVNHWWQQEGHPTKIAHFTGGYWNMWAFRGVMHSFKQCLWWPVFYHGSWVSVGEIAAQSCCQLLAVDADVKTCSASAWQFVVHAV